MNMQRMYVLRDSVYSIVIIGNLIFLVRPIPLRNLTRMHGYITLFYWLVFILNALQVPKFVTVDRLEAIGTFHLRPLFLFGFL